MTHPQPSERPSAKFEDGAIWWRGSNDRFIYLPRDDAQRRLDRFVLSAHACDFFSPRAKEIAADLVDAIIAYDEAYAETD